MIDLKKKLYQRKWIKKNRQWKNTYNKLWMSHQRAKDREKIIKEKVENLRQQTTELWRFLVRTKK